MPDSASLLTGTYHRLEAEDGYDCSSSRMHEHGNQIDRYLLEVVEKNGTGPRLRKRLFVWHYRGGLHGTELLGNVFLVYVPCVDYTSACKIVKVGSLTHKSVNLNKSVPFFSLNGC